MRKFLSACALALCAAGTAFGDASAGTAPLRLTPAKLEPFASRASAAAFSSEPISEQVLADVLWAANGVNRGNGKRTAPTALNKQEISVYVVRGDGAFAAELGADAVVLTRVSAADLRPLVVSTQPQFGNAPVMLLLVADLEQFSMMPPERARLAAAVDTGGVMQNILLACAAKGLGARPRLQMDSAALAEALALPPGTVPMLNIVVGAEAVPAAGK